MSAEDGRKDVNARRSGVLVNIPDLILPKLAGFAGQWAGEGSGGGQYAVLRRGRIDYCGVLLSSGRRRSGGRWEARRAGRGA